MIKTKTKCFIKIYNLFKKTKLFVILHNIISIQSHMFVEKFVSMKSENEKLRA